MDFEILSEEYRIAAAESEALKGCLFLYLPKTDVILINAAAQSKKELAELMKVYLDLPHQGRKEVRSYAANNTAIQEYLDILNQITRIRRRLYKSRQGRQRLLHRFSA